MKESAIYLRYEIYYQHHCTDGSTPEEEEPPPPLPEKHAYADYSNIFANDDASIIPERASTLPRSLTHKEKVSISFKMGVVGATQFVLRLLKRCTIRFK